MKLTKNTPFRLPERLYDRVMKLARAADRTFADQLRWLIQAGAGRVCKRCGGTGFDPGEEK